MAKIVNVSLIKTDFKCPKCGHIHGESDWFHRSKPLFYMDCKNQKCKEKLGVTTDIRGDVVVWRKSEE